MNGIYDHIRSKKFDKYNKLNGFTPEYAVYNGKYSVPSKFWFGHKLLLDTLNVWIDIDTLCEKLRLKLISELQKYGSQYPNETSSHVMLHKIVAHVIEDKFENCYEYKSEMLIECYNEYRKTKGLYGNIYRNDLLDATIEGIKDFLNIRFSKNYSTGTDADKTNDHKIRSEIDKMKLLVKYNEVYLDEAIIMKHRPRIIHHDGNRHVNDAEKKNVESKFNKIDYIDKNSRIDVVTVNITDPILFGDKTMEINKMLPIWNKEQNDIISKIVMEDKINVDDIKYIGGMDISFEKNSNNGIACLVIFDFKTLKLVGQFTIKCTVEVPYKAGYLAFREAPPLLKLIDIVNTDYPELVPQLIMMDGNGIWHPRGCGIATHFSTLTGIPCIGVAKNVLVVDNVNDDFVKEKLEKQAPNQNMHTYITTDSGRIIGCAYNATGSIKKSLYVSVGNGVSLETAMKIVETVNKYRVSETIRQADHISRLLLVE